MNYVMANCPDTDTFAKDVMRWASIGVTFKHHFIEHITDAPVSGGWGCAIFNMPAPSGTIFDLPNTEYRYSDEMGLWLANGQITPASEFANSIYNYFASLEAQQQ